MSAPPLPRSGQAFMDAAREAGWTLTGRTGQQSLSGDWYHELEASHPDGGLRQVRLGYLAGRLRSVLLWQPTRAGWATGTLKAAHGYLAEES